MTEETIQVYENKAWHFTFLITILAIAATYLTIAELKEVARSLEQREMVGQRENYAKKLSLFSNCMVCIWNMCYSLTFFIISLYLQVSGNDFSDEL